MSLQKVELAFTVNERGAPVIQVMYDKESEAIEQKLLGLLLKNAKSNNNTLAVECVKVFSDGQESFEIKVMGT